MARGTRQGQIAVQSSNANLLHAADVWLTAFVLGSASTLLAMDALMKVPREYTYPLIPWLFVLIGIKGVCQFSAWRLRNSDTSHPHRPSDQANIDGDSDEPDTSQHDRT